MQNKFIYLLAVILVLGLTVGAQQAYAEASITVTVSTGGLAVIPNNSYVASKASWFIINVSSNETLNISSGSTPLRIVVTNVTGGGEANYTVGITHVLNNDTNSGNYSYINITNLNTNGAYYVGIRGWQSNNTGVNHTSLNLRNFTIDNSTPHVLSINTPTPAQDFVQSSPKLDLNISAGDLQSKITCVYDLNGVNFTISAFVNSSCVNITFSPITGGNSLTLWVNDSANNVNRSVITFTFRQLASGGGGGGGGGGGDSSALPGSVVSVTFGSLTTQQKKALNTAGGTPIYILELTPAVDIALASVDMQIIAFPTTPNIGRKNYAHLELIPSFTNSDILGAKVSFKVPKAWMAENNVKEASLWRYNNAVWKEMPTTKVSEDELNAFYRSDIPGFSIFSISEASGLTYTIGTGSDILSGAGGGLTFGSWDIPYLLIIIIVIIIIIAIVWLRRR